MYFCVKFKNKLIMKLKIGIAKVFLFFGIVVIIGLYCVNYTQSEQIVTIKIKSKERVSENTTGSSRYLIFCDNEVFENTDSFLYGKYNSSDIYGMLEIGKTYTVKVAGWRIPAMSSYRNILSIEEFNGI